VIAKFSTAIWINDSHVLTPSARIKNTQQSEVRLEFELAVTKDMMPYNLGSG